MKKQTRLTLAALGCAAVPLSSIAEEKALAVVEVVDQRAAQIERKNSAVQKIVIAEEEIERFGDATVGDVLRRLPGMTFTGPAGVVKDIRMRGLDKGYTQFLINGEPVPSAKQERQIQIDRLPADMIERIEIVRNPSAEYDAAAIGGIVNIVLKQRPDDLTRLRLSYGKNGELDVGDAIAQWSRRFDTVDLVLTASHTIGGEDIVEDKQKFNAAGAVTEREHKPKPIEKTETLLSPRITWRLGDDRLVFEPFISAGTEDKVESAVVRNGAGALTKTNSNSEDKTDTIGRLGLRYEAARPWGGWHLKGGVQQGEEEKEKFTTEKSGAGVITKRSREDESIDEDQAYLGAGLALTLGRHGLKAGIEGRNTEYAKRKRVAEANNATNALAPKAPGANDIYRIEETKTAVYLLDEWHFAADHWLTPGVRYEHTERDASNRNGVTRSSRDDSPNPSLHYRWAISENLNLRASAARTLRLPKFDDLNPLVTLAAANSLTTPDKGGNAELKPEVATGFEIGMEKFVQGNRGAVGINVYQRDVKDNILKVTRQEGGRFVERPQNVGNARYWGAELDWRYALLHKGAHELTLTGSHAEMRGRVENVRTGLDGDVNDLPPSVSNLGLDWRHRPTLWSAGFSVNYQPEFTTDGLNPEGAREIKRRNASTLLDLYVAKIFSPLAEFRLVAKNVLAVEKDEETTKIKADGSFEAREAKTERSRPTVYLTWESRF